jgi:hypothetical protein
MKARPVPRLLGAVAVVALAASCASSSGRTRVPRPTAPLPPTNRARTQLETQRLVALVPLPSRRTVVAHAVALPGPPEPVSTGLVDTAAGWTVPMSLALALAWAQAHRPAGLSEQGAASASSLGTVTSTGLSYRAPDSRYWVGAELAVTLSPAGPASTHWRVDGMAQWLDPTPVRDSSTGPRIRVTAASGCPQSDQGVVSVTNSGGGLGQALLPAGVPTSAVVCTYQGINGHPFRLRTHRTIAAVRARTLAASARALNVAHVDGVTTSCPSGQATAMLFAFAYPGRTVDLWYDDSGCASVANGVIVVSGVGGSIAPFVDAARRDLK